MSDTFKMKDLSVRDIILPVLRAIEPELKRIIREATIQSIESIELIKGHATTENSLGNKINPPKFLSINEVSKLLGRSRSTVYSYVKLKILKPFHLPGIRGSWFAEEDVLNILKQYPSKYNLKNSI